MDRILIGKYKMELVEPEVREKAREAGFLGWIEFREWMPAPALYDSGVFPDEEVGSLILELRKYLPPYARGKPVIYLQYLGRTRKQILAALAHELGHNEQSPLLRPVLVSSPEWLRRELEAQALGLKWAVKWGVVSQFLVTDRLLKKAIAYW